MYNPTWPAIQPNLWPDNSLYQDCPIWIELDGLKDAEDDPTMFVPRRETEFIYDSVVLTFGLYNSKSILCQFWAVCGLCWAEDEFFFPLQNASYCTMWRWHEAVWSKSNSLERTPLRRLGWMVRSNNTSSTLRDSEKRQILKQLLCVLPQV